jgi:hypothetical protein
LRRRCLNTKLLALVARRRCLGRLTRLARNPTSPPTSTTSPPPAPTIRTRRTFANLFFLAHTRRRIQRLVLHRSKTPRLFYRVLRTPNLRRSLTIPTIPIPVATIPPPTPTAISAARTLAAAFTPRPLASRRTLAATRRAIKVRSVPGLFHEISDVQEGIPLQPDVHKARLHAWQNARHASVVNRSSERVLILALVINLGKLFFFDNRQTCLVWRARYINLFRHCSASPRTRLSSRRALAEQAKIALHKL